MSSLTFEATQRCLVMENGRAVLTGAAAELRHKSKA
jgi:ABC-type branched-subunit amino acid transport system ATPase component